MGSPGRASRPRANASHRSRTTHRSKGMRSPTRRRATRRRAARRRAPGAAAQTSTTKNPAIWINRRCAVVKPVGSGARRLFGCSGLIAGCIRVPSLVPARACSVRASARHITGGGRCGGSCCHGRRNSRHLRRFGRSHLLRACILGSLGHANR
jgi:hypothetical protein